jgi:hypothetical protein
LLWLSLLEKIRAVIILNWIKVAARSIIQGLPSCLIPRVPLRFMTVPRLPLPKYTHKSAAHFLRPVLLLCRYVDLCNRRGSALQVQTRERAREGEFILILFNCLGKLFYMRPFLLP